MNINNEIGPDPKWHRNISFAKSALRIAAGIAFFNLNIAYGGALLIVAELLGVVEEMV